MISELGEITLDSGSAILNARAAYDALSEASTRTIMVQTGEAVLTIYKKHISTDTTIIRSTLEMLEAYKVEVEHITLGVDSFNVVMPTAQIRDRIYDIISDIKRKLKPDRIKTDDNIALIACVGRRMVSVPGSSAKLFGALGEKNINIRMIAQGSEEISIIVGVNNRDFENTTQETGM